MKIEGTTSVLGVTDSIYHREKEQKHQYQNKCTKEMVDVVGMDEAEGNT